MHGTWSLLFALFFWITPVKSWSVGPKVVNGTWVPAPSKSSNSSSDSSTLSSGLELNTDASTGKVQVRFLKGSKVKAPSIGILLLDQNGKGTQLELESMKPPFQFNAFQGDLNKVGSFVGFELKIPVGSGKTKVLRSKDMKKLQSSQPSTR